MVAVDLFAGAGGLSEGFIEAGFDIVSYVECDKYSCETLRTRHQYWQLLENEQIDIYIKYLKGKLSYESFRDHLDGIDPVISLEINADNIGYIEQEIKKRLVYYGKNEIDLFIGGPPCQPYSLIGRARSPIKMNKDSRRNLYKYYIELMKEFKPKAFVFENVPGLLSLEKGKFIKDIVKKFNDAGYCVNTKNSLFDSNNFGVMQHRKRIILIGWKKELKLSLPNFVKVEQNHKVAEVLDDLPPISPGEKTNSKTYTSEISNYLKKTKIRKESDILTQHETRNIRELDREIYREVIKTWNCENRRLHYSELPKHLIKHKNVNTFTDRFKVVASENTYCQSILAHMAKDGHYYIHPSLEQARSLSIREAARIQSFPDNYYFEGHGLQRYKQIGNAVPPLMAYGIAKGMKKMLEQYDDTS